MYSSGFRKSGWLKKYLAHLSDENPDGRVEPSKAKEATLVSLESLDGLLYQKSKRNGLLLGCPVLEGGLEGSKFEFSFPEKTGEALLVYLDTLFQTGLELVR